MNAVGGDPLLERAPASTRPGHAVVVGRSNLFGKPMAQMLAKANATMTLCHRHTRDLRSFCRRAEILVVAVGRAKMVKGDWIRACATVVDVGSNRTKDGWSATWTSQRLADRRRDHPSARRRRADDDRLPASQHARGGYRLGCLRALQASSCRGPPDQTLDSPARPLLVLQSAQSSRIGGGGVEPRDA